MKTFRQYISEDLVQAKSNIPSEQGYVYHATNTENAADIARTGLKAFRPDHGTDQTSWPDGKTEPRIYASPRADVVWQFAPENGRSCVLRIKTSAAQFRREIGTGDVYCNKSIPATAIEVLTDSGWVSLKQAFHA